MKKERYIPNNIPDLFFSTAEKYPDREVLKYKIGHHYHSLSYRELEKEVVGLAIGLKRLGLKPGERVVLISENRPEWVISDLALVSLGLVDVPIHSVLSSDQLAGIIKETRPRAVFFSDRETEAKLLEIVEEIGGIEFLISFESIGGENFDHLKYFKDLIDETKYTQEEADDLIKTARSIKGDQDASIIYTSGTTGHLKGVQLTHSNFIQNILGVFGNLQSYPEDRFFSILPLSHVLERTCGYYVPIYSGSSIGYALDINNVAGEIRERKPTIVIAVPRLFEKIHEKVVAKAESNLVSKLIFHAGMKYRPKNKKDLLEKVFDKLIFSKIRENFGGEIRFFVSGGAKLPEKLGKFFERVGLYILEGYGLTETSPVVAVNKLTDYKFGTVGQVLNNLKVKIGKDEEILVKGPSVMKGYLRKEDNEGILTSDGWFRTGDLGYLDDRGFLTITGRRKDLIVLTTGKKIAPVPIEEALESSEYIEQAMVFGEGHKHIGALIVPSYTRLEERFGAHEKDKLLKNPEVMQLLTTEADEMTKHLASIERVRKFSILKAPFTVDNGELTPTLKIRRKVIHEKYAEEIERVYS